MTPEQDSPDFNPTDPEFAENPFPILRALREADPVMPLDGGSAYVVTGHEAAWEMLRRKDGDTRWVEFQQRRMGPGVEDEPYCKINVDNVLMTSGDQHRRIRGTFQRNFRAKEMEEMRASVAGEAHRLIDRFADRGEVELVEEFASPLPLWAISQLLKVPHSDEQLIVGWMQGFLLSVQLLPLTPEQLEKANNAITSLNEYFGALIAERRRSPMESDLLTLLIAEADAGAMTEEELTVNAWNLYVGGHDTTSMTISNGTVSLLQHPEQMQRLAADPSLLPNAVEEILRYIGPVQGTHRLLPEEIELGDHEIPADTPVMIYLSGANHDDALCPHAGEFDITREVPFNHLAFGTGPHKCPGQHMARMMVSTGLEALFSRLPELRLVDVKWDTEVMNFRGPESLHLAW